MLGITPINRGLLKEQSKEWMRSAQPPFWQAALLYLLVTATLPDVVQRFLPGQQMLQEASNYLSNGQPEMAEYLVWQVFQGSTGLTLIFVTVLLGLLSMVVNYGYVGYSLDVVRGRSPACTEVFSRFYMAGKIIAAELLMALFVFLWSLLFVIPGIIALYRYWMIPYILMDDPDCTVLEAFRRSKELMRGRKWEAFVLGLSFFLWILAASCLITVVDYLNILPLYLLVSLACNMFLVPYQQYTYCQWYDAVCAQDAELRGPRQNFSQYGQD